MPPGLPMRAAAYGAAYGLTPIGWIVLNIIFLYRLTQELSRFSMLRDSVARVSNDSRLQLLQLAFCFGAFFEGAAGFGAPAAYAALATPLITLACVTELPPHQLSALVGRQMLLFSLLVPYCLLVAYCGRRRTMQIWPAILMAGGSSALAKLLISNLHGPWLAAIGTALIPMTCLVGFLRIWKPAQVVSIEGTGSAALAPVRHDGHVLMRAWLPWVPLILVVFLWRVPQIQGSLDHLFTLVVPFGDLDEHVQRLPPLVVVLTIERALLNLNLPSATGTAILLSALIAAVAPGATMKQIVVSNLRALRATFPNLLIIAAMLDLGNLTRYASIDAKLGLAFAATGTLYPFFGTLLGWLGVAATGSDTDSNVLFGGLQKVTSQPLGLPPVPMAAANSPGGVMGTMVDAQSIVLASIATHAHGEEGQILRYVICQSLAPVALVGLVVILMAFVPPFSWLVPR
jgi:lactate permease